MTSKRSLRSAAWFASTDKDGFIHRSWMRGYPDDVFDGRPVIGTLQYMVGADSVQRSFS